MRGYPSRAGLRVALVALAVGAWLVVGASSASAGAVTCGQTITQDTTVDNDLSNCPGDGLVVGADNITLDLNGHTVSGPGATPTSSAGVRVTGRSGVTVRNGTVAQFDREVSVQGSANRVLLLTLGAGPQGSLGVLSPVDRATPSRSTACLAVSHRASTWRVRPAMRLPSTLVRDESRPTSTPTTIES